MGNASFVMHQKVKRMDDLLTNAGKAQRVAEDVVSLMHVKERRNATALKVEAAEKLEEETAARDKELKKAARKEIFELGKLSEANLALANKASQKLKEAHGMEADRTKAKLALEGKLSALRRAQRKLATAKEVLNRFMGEKLTQFEDWLSGGSHTDQKAEAEAHDMVKHAREMHERAHQAEVATQVSALAVKRLSEQASVAHDLAQSAAKEAEDICETARKAEESSNKVGSFDQWLAGSPVSKDQLAEAQLHCKEAKAEAARKQDAQKVAADAEAKAWKQLEAGKTQAAAAGETAKATLAKAMKYVKFARKRSADENAAWEDAKKEAQRRVKAAMEVVDHADSAVSEARNKLEQIKSAIQKLTRKPPWHCAQKRTRLNLKLWQQMLRTEQLQMLWCRLKLKPSPRVITSCVLLMSSGGRGREFLSKNFLLRRGSRRARHLLKFAPSLQISLLTWSLLKRLLLIPLMM